MSAFNVNAKNLGYPDGAWWTIRNGDDSGISAMTAFDFNNDNYSEIVFRAEKEIRVIYGGVKPFPKGVDMNRNWSTGISNSYTANEYPIVADIDNDGESEIITIGGLKDGDE